MPGRYFEAEIREQPAVWRRIAGSDDARRVADAVRGRDVVLVGSGSSLFMARLGALAFRRRAQRAHALAATEAPFDHAAYRGEVVVACSQSGESSDVLTALDVLEPARLIAITNTPDSPLAQRADVTIDLACGPERAVPATKSVTATAAVLLWAAGLLAQEHGRNAKTLHAAADAVDAWLASESVDDVRTAAEAIAQRRSVAIVGAGYGVPIAQEAALKLIEASYVHAQGFSAGEFRHGSTAMLDPHTALIGIVDEASRAIVERPLREAENAHSLRYTIGATAGGVVLLGPRPTAAYNTLAWLVTAQMLALFAGRARGIDSDAPRGLSKTVR